MSEIISERSEFLFLYEVKDANPNGDPLDENKPRMDPDTGVATVTDVRIKRTARDYWIAHKDQDKEKQVLIRETYSPAGFLADAKFRAGEIVSDELAKKEFDNILTAESEFATEILKKCIDARVFGCTLPFTAFTKGRRDKKSNESKQGKHEGKGQKKEEKEKKETRDPRRTDGSITLTGPVQISCFNRSLHRVSPWFVRGTGAFASKEGLSRKTFREEYFLPYACIAAYGVVNEVAAKSTGMTKQDRDLLMEALWKGTKDLITRSKMGHLPLLLIHLIYKDGWRLGDLPGRISLEPLEDVEGPEIRDIGQYTICVNKLIEPLKANAERLAFIQVLGDERLRLQLNGDLFEPAQLPSKIGLEHRPFPFKD